MMLTNQPSFHRYYYLPDTRQVTSEPAIRRFSRTDKYSLAVIICTTILAVIPL